jgi:hypothetical protein
MHTQAQGLRSRSTRLTPAELHHRDHHTRLGFFFSAPARAIFFFLRLVFCALFNLSALGSAPCIVCRWVFCIFVKRAADLNIAFMLSLLSSSALRFWLLSRLHFFYYLEIASRARVRFWGRAIRVAMSAPSET